MNYAEIESKFNTTKFDPTPYIQATLDDESIKKELIDNIICGDNHINYYFNSYLIVHEAAKVSPTIFYQYWEDFWALHNHPNSYHRLIAHDLITDLIPVDKDEKWKEIIDEYLDAMNDVKISNTIKTTKNVIHASKFIQIHERLHNIFTNPNHLNRFSDKQQKRLHRLYAEYFSTLPKSSGTFSAK